MRAIIFDCEIINAIQGKNEPRVPGITYCGGWRDFRGMGISVVGVYDYAEDRYRVFCNDNLAAFVELATAADLFISYNGYGFDNRLVAANTDDTVGKMFDAKTYDLLREVWVAAGLAPEFSYPSHVGYGLADVSQANGGPPKTGHGAQAPVLWQQGKIGQTIDYCLNDIHLTRLLVDQVRRGVPIACPKTGRLLPVRSPF